MRHRRCEAVFEGYSGLHKWNVDINDANEFILWNEDNMVNVNKALQDYAKIDVVLQKGCGRSEEMIEINIYKEKQFERNLFFDVEVDCKMLAQIVDKLMRMLSLLNINQQFEDLLKYV